MDCSKCKTKEKPETEKPDSFVWEMLREQGKMNKRLIVVILTLMGLWFATIGGFVWYLNQYDFVSYEYSQDGEG